MNILADTWKQGKKRKEERGQFLQCHQRESESVSPSIYHQIKKDRERRLSDTYSPLVPDIGGLSQSKGALLSSEFSDGRAAEKI